MKTPRLLRPSQVPIWCLLLSWTLNSSNCQRHVLSLQRHSSAYSNLASVPITVRKLFLTNSQSKLPDTVGSLASSFLTRIGRIQPSWSLLSWRASPLDRICCLSLAVLPFLHGPPTKETHRALPWAPYHVSIHHHPNWHHAFPGF